MMSTYIIFHESDVKKYFEEVIHYTLDAHEPISIDIQIDNRQAG